MGTEKRDLEAVELRGEVQYLKDELAKEQADRQAMQQKLSIAHAAESTLTKADIEKVNSAKTTEIAKLTSSLEEEGKRALHAQQELAAKFEAEIVERKADSEAFIRDLGEQKTQAAEIQTETKSWLNNITLDLKKLVEQAQQADKVWDDFKYSGLMCLSEKVSA